MPALVGGFEGAAFFCPAVNPMLSLARYEPTGEDKGPGCFSEQGALRSGLGFTPFAARLAATCRLISSKDMRGCDKRLFRDSSGENGFRGMTLQNTLPRPLCKPFRLRGAIRWKALMGNSFVRR